MTTRHYLAVAEHNPRGWSISFPAFPGTVTTGNTFAALMTHAPDALASVIEAMQEDGATIPGSFNGSPRSFIAADHQNPHIVLVPMQIGGNLMP
jgi:predicted RNase H-like HicB family nuclease